MIDRKNTYDFSLLSTSNKHRKELCLKENELNSMKQDPRDELVKQGNRIDFLRIICVLSLSFSEPNLIFNDDAIIITYLTYILQRKRKIKG